MRVISTIPFTRGQWNSHTNLEWEGFYFMEAVLDWSLYKGCKGKLMVETMDANVPPEGGWLRLAYQYKPAKFITLEGSEIKTQNTNSVRWSLQETDWFDLPETDGVACLWIQGKAEPEKRISVALATLVIVSDE